MTTEQTEQMRMQLSAVHATATALIQQVAVALAGMPVPEQPAPRKRAPVASDLPADLND